MKKKNLAITILLLTTITITVLDFIKIISYRNHPGWHVEVEANLAFVIAGAIASNLSMILLLLILVRKIFNLESVIDIPFIELANKILLAFTTINAVFYAGEFISAWYSGVQYEAYAFSNRAFGTYWWAYWSMLVLNFLLPQLFWFRKIRTSILATLLILIFMNFGWWLERLIILATSFHRDYLPSSWVSYSDIYTDLASLAIVVFVIILLFLKLKKRK